MELQSSEPLVDWSALPKAALMQIIHNCFECSEDAPLDFKHAARTATALALVCKHWSQVLEESPPLLHLKVDSTAPFGSTRYWIPRFPLQSVVLLPETQTDMEALIIMMHMQQCILIDNPYCKATLQSYALHLSVLPHDELYGRLQGYRCAIFEGFQRLESLTLSVAGKYDLAGIPSSVRHLNLTYFGTWKQDVLSSHGIAMLHIPSHLQFDTLTINRQGVLGLSLEQLTRQCRHVTINAMFALVGVTIPDENLVTTYSRPYVEGDYVPPHILGDMEALETSNMAADRTSTHFLLDVAASPKLERLEFTGECSGSVKIIPCKQGVHAVAKQVEFVHNITKQATLYLYGMSGAELIDRLLDLRASGRLNALNMNITVDDHDERFVIEVDRAHNVNCANAGDATVVVVAAEELGGAQI